ncbi:MAG TPA: glycerol-3-phosphate responsive antiterminator [Bacillota bacterium]|nr:glycerol-3-phosphate responsive antiterminator [Bacillota bacterium]
MNALEYALKRNPIIVSVTDQGDLAKALQAESSIIILIQADLRTLKDVTDKIKETDNLIFVHMDLIKGLKRDPSGIQFLADHIGIDGIVTTHANLIQIAKRLKLLTIQRVFVLDTASIKQGVKSIRESKPDAVEILPGIAVPHIQKEIQSHIKPIVIAAGLINTKEEITHVLKNGAQGISSSSTDLWNLSSDVKKALKYPVN